jgi:predicted PolB exonuclease-like 3'-5' exonuclease
VTPVLAFDIETVPDADGIRRVLSFGPELSDSSVVEFAMQRRRQASGNDFLPPHLQRVVAISCALRSNDGFRVWSLGTPADAEREIVQRFFDGIEKYTPQLVSWNGSSFDLPVLHYRAMFHGIAGCCYWDTGDNNKEFRFNNYLSRFHTRHTDLMDVLAGFQNRAWAPLDELARLCGFPGKLGMDGSQVWAAWTRGEIEAIRNYCETDVANTFLLFQRFQMLRGVLSAEEYGKELEVVRAFLEAQAAPHWREFSAAWKPPA